MDGPNIILFTGFLGSGKTSLLLKCAKHLAETKKRSAIIVNEVGEIGIDNLQMKIMGFDVWEIFGGCICCTLAISLEETLAQLITNYELDYILMEPSGAADPSAIYPALSHCGFKKEKIRNVMILDPTRIEMLETVLEPYLAASVPLADYAIINKIDVAAAAEIWKAQMVINQYHEGVPIVLIDVKRLLDEQIHEIMEG